ncbi:putative phosphotransferase enzyme IIB component M6 [Clostridium pasteurianum DSM 525 = ATCC 6013]|uniref:Protein-N(Pi)-phosphohistidine--sugar phosphotransferase n=1 Tax=Clostridium pasteurianum DSM 525 = ATCC 6013 TaxID=1262449 RepID=A0A0H3J706_CLOPA|nr:PTS sugar transporter subunit IIB [Clostridium pasteurianum]AJA49254.1 putative phosphotransferase enzyme IIB component M6 [Clostridium pasteurianum DSM 525 = ATCC 6013]AJA53242.1 putative phosphotransferase enzyme IIB component M6 [Clostridium pasteurianum DSM 525 = ATCC 6013]AOZ76432.1 PTS sorbose transporter subunit IIB [Clostridium pasteurianum DSM 525 = ATCC 6013]AOZ80229.1 PTS sorbose transporter subunit IIB [Clostridium pasteurianum]ELP58274.1 PTS system mannose/fructose family trans
MIAALRVDDRLIHGQVALGWSKELKIQGIVVANDAAAKDEMQKMTLKMAAPNSIKVLIKSVEDAIGVVNNPKAAKMRILLITRNIKDALKICESVEKIEYVNIGNVGRFDGIDVSEKTTLSPTVMLTKDEIDSLKKIIEIDPNTSLQAVPSDEKKPMKDIIRKINL